jgi:hypothetical protein
MTSYKVSRLSIFLRGDEKTFSKVLYKGLHMTNSFQCAGGGIPGFEHTQRSNVLIGKNNQDAWRLYGRDGLTICLVADGCGSKAHSEVGSQLALGALAASIEKNWIRYGTSGNEFERSLEATLESSRREALALLSTIAHSLLPMYGDDGQRASYSELVSDHFLFTIVGALITEEAAGFFAIGDGLIVLNKELISLGPFEGNEPPYMAYSLLKTRWREEELRFKIHRCCLVTELESFLIGTDGVLDLADAEHKTLPGSSECIGPLQQFWSEDRYFTKSGIRKRLARIQSRQQNHSEMGSPMEEGRLRDDTTLIVGRKIRS